MAELNDKEVYFSKYCKTCKYRFKKENLDPCEECLENPSNKGSHKPLNYIPSGGKS